MFVLQLVRRYSGVPASRSIAELYRLEPALPAARVGSIRCALVALQLFALRWCSNHSVAFSSFVYPLVFKALRGFLVTGFLVTGFLVTGSLVTPWFSSHSRLSGRVL